VNGEAAMEVVPTYALYGETNENLHEQWLHCESIAARSALFNWRIAPHRHPRFFQILHLKRGAAEVSLAAGSRTAVPPCVITVPPRAVHGFRFASDVDGHVVTLSAERFERMVAAAPDLQALLRAPQVISLAGAPADELARVIDGIAHEFAGSLPWRSALIEAQLVIALVAVGRFVSAAGPGSTPAAPERRALEFRMLVDRDFRLQHSVGAYAAMLGVSQTHLNRLCRAAFNESALGVINRRLVLEATRDLTFTFMSVKEIATSLGFADAAYFSRFFTRHAGVSPTQFSAAQQQRREG
jgi:AraC family transcriptional activator of pobA